MAKAAQIEQTQRTAIELAISKVVSEGEISFRDLAKRIGFPVAMVRSVAKKQSFKKWITTYDDTVKPMGTRAESTAYLKALFVDIKSADKMDLIRVMARMGLLRDAEEACEVFSIPRN